MWQSFRCDGIALYPIIAIFMLSCTYIVIDLVTLQVQYGQWHFTRSLLVLCIKINVHVVGGIEHRDYNNKCSPWFSHSLTYACSLNASSSVLMTVMPRLSLLPIISRAYGDLLTDPTGDLDISLSTSRWCCEWWDLDISRWPCWERWECAISAILKWKFQILLREVKYSGQM